MHNSFASLGFVITLSLLQEKLGYSKLVKRDYMHSHLLKYIKRLCLTYKIRGKYCEKNYELLFSRMIKCSRSVSCDIDNVRAINDIVKLSSAKITTITNSFGDICINKPPLPPDVFDGVNTPISCINTTDIDDTEGSSSYNLKDAAKSSKIPCENIPPSVFFSWGWIFN